LHDEWAQRNEKLERMRILREEIRLAKERTAKRAIQSQMSTNQLNVSNSRKLYEDPSEKESRLEALTR